jgi:hypothetical protein
VHLYTLEVVVVEIDPGQVRQLAELQRNLACTANEVREKDMLTFSNKLSMTIIPIPQCAQKPKESDHMMGH